MQIIISAIALIVVALAVAGLAMAVWYRRVVPTNMVHIVQSAKSTVAFGRGKEAGNTYYAWPSWVPHLGITVTEFPESIFQVSLENYEAYDVARLPFMIDAVSFFRVSDAAVAAQRVSHFGELKNQLQAVLQGAVRRVLATNTLEEIMQSRSELGDQFTQEVQEQIAEWGVLPVKTIEFMDLRDSPKGQVISNIMAKEQSRIEMESRVKVAENKRSAELAEIDARRTVDVQRQDAEQQVGLRTAEKEKVVGIAKEQSLQEIKVSAKTTAEREMDVKKVTEVRGADIAREVAVVKAEQAKRVTVVDAEARRDAAVVAAEADKQSKSVRAEGDLLATLKVAEGNLQTALKDAEGIRARGESNAAAEQAMLMAPVVAQIKLAEEIGSNEGYQKYLVTNEQVKAARDVGLEMARAMQAADLKIIANGGDIQQGIGKLTDMFTPAGGTSLSGMLAALSQTTEGADLMKSVTARLAGGTTSLTGTSSS